MVQKTALELYSFLAITQPELLPENINTQDKMMETIDSIDEVISKLLSLLALHVSYPNIDTGEMQKLNDKVETLLQSRSYFESLFSAWDEAEKQKK